MLKQLVSIISPEDADTIPKSNKWDKKGEILGDNYSFAWRLFRAEEFGSVVSRTRIYLVGDLTGGSAGEILFTINEIPTEVHNCLRWVEGAAVPQSTANEIAGTITRPDNYYCKKKIGKNITIPVLACIGHNYISFSETTLPTLTCNLAGKMCVAIPDNGSYKFRYILPPECALAMGFPEWWCSGLEVKNPSQEMIDYYKSLFLSCGKEKTDKQVEQFLASPYSGAQEYKLWGNGIVLANAKVVLSSIVSYAS